MKQNEIMKRVILGLLVLAVTGLFVIKEIKKEDHIKHSQEIARIEEESTSTLTVRPGAGDEVKRDKDTQTDSQEQPGVIATVNRRQITEKDLEERFQSLPDKYKSAYKNNKEGLLEQLIVEEVLYQEAVNQGYMKKNETVDPEHKIAAIRKLITSVSEDVAVTETELREFYDNHPTEVQGASYDQIKMSIKDYLTGQKQNELVERLITDLKQKSQINRDQKWLAGQAASKSQNPLTEALKNGKPTVLDMGAGSCIPCKMMKPIFEELEKEYQGRANIILLEVNDYRDLAVQYQVRVIPTQIFFDQRGKQVWRHEGFLAKDEIVKKLKELGVY